MKLLEKTSNKILFGLILFGLIVTFALMLAIRLLV